MIFFKLLCLPLPLKKKKKRKQEWHGIPNWRGSKSCHVGVSALRATQVPTTLELDISLGRTGRRVTKSTFFSSSKHKLGYSWNYKSPTERNIIISVWKNQIKRIVTFNLTEKLQSMCDFGSNISELMLVLNNKWFHICCHFLKSGFKFTTNLKGKSRDFPYIPSLHTCIAFPIINITHQNGTSFIKINLNSTSQSPKSIVYYNILVLYIPMGLDKVWHVSIMYLWHV